MKICGIFLVWFLVETITCAPTLYEYYTGDGIDSGLSVDQPYFTLNGKNITIMSGTIHYFRVPPQYWRDRLRKLRAAGLNAVETYVAWNLHEPENGSFDFGDGGSDMEQFLDVATYLKTAQEEDLFVILRPGPYICAEWEWGGLPSWLLREENITVRTSDSVYMSYVTRYYEKLLSIVEPLQFTKGGPVIAVQVENEYGSAPTRDLDYIQQVYDLLKNNGIVELLVSSDGASAESSGTIPELIFQTVNFGGDPTSSFDKLKEFQPDKPIMAMEYWSGWFDHWSEVHHTVDNNTFHSHVDAILAYPASLNMYMFHGGTNFGFLNGANIVTGNNAGYQPTTTSYDYDGPLSEAGDYTAKYYIVQELVEKYKTVDLAKPDPPELVERVEYPTINIEGQLGYDDLTAKAPYSLTSEKPLSMEFLPINNNSGQSYGYIIYRQEFIDIPENANLTIKGHLRDTLMILINGKLISQPLSNSDDLNDFGYYRVEDSSIILTDTLIKNATLDLIIENWGRANFGNFYYQFKGLIEENTVLLNDEELSNWIMMPLEFKKAWNLQLGDWKSADELVSGPGLFKATLTIDDEPKDTYIDMDEWTKGVVIVNGFVLGRHALIGPQQTLYLPAPFLQKGDNEIVVFEHFKAASRIRFSKDPFFKTV